jgi:hypothetical protein
MVLSVTFIVVLVIVPCLAAGLWLLRRGAQEDRSAGMVRCRACGQNVPADARFCGHCGERLH